MWLFRYVVISLCGNFVMWLFRFVVISLCGYFIMWSYLFLRYVMSNMKYLRLTETQAQIEPFVICNKRFVQHVE